MPYKYLAIGVLIILIAALYFRNYLPFSSFFDNQPPPTLNKYEEELKAENKAIELNPNDVKAHYNRGNSLYGLGKYELAINAYDRAIELDPNNFKACFNKARILEELGKYDLAIESYNTALEINPDYSEAKARKQALLNGM